MPQTQAYNVTWTVEITPLGDVSDDVTSITYTRERDRPNSVTVELDTSTNSYTLEALANITVELTDGNKTVTFNGFVDETNDSPDEPKTTVDARKNVGRLDDVNVVGSYSGNDIWDVVNAIVDTGPSALSNITFDEAATRNSYGVFAGQTDFGGVNIAHFGFLNEDSESFNTRETASDNRGRPAELRIKDYVNNTGSTFSFTLTGHDAVGNTVEASVDLPPGSSAKDAYGTDQFKLALVGGNRVWSQVDSLTDNVSGLSGDDRVVMDAEVYNYVKTDYSFSASDDATMNAVIQKLVNYVETLDDGDPWEFYVNSSNQLVIQPKASFTPTRFTFTEGQNVLRPVATRNLDGVANYVEVKDAENRGVWSWAYKGSFYTYWGYENPHSRGSFPDDTTDKYLWEWKQSPANGINDIDEIGLRATSVQNSDLSGWYPTLNACQSTLDSVYRQAVSGTAPVPGIIDVVPGDEAEVYYPSRGIPQKVADNVFTVQKVEYNVEPNEAVTKVEFGVKRPTATREIANAAISEIQARDDVSLGGGSGGGFNPKIAKIDAVNDDGTVDVTTNDGTEFTGVEII